MTPERKEELRKRLANAERTYGVYYPAALATGVIRGGLELLAEVERLEEELGLVKARYAEAAAALHDERHWGVLGPSVAYEACEQPECVTARGLTAPVDPPAKPG